jgi:hypothetical protein
MRSRIPHPAGVHDVNGARTGGAWYRQPVLWLGALIFAASLAGCVWMVVLASRHADVPVETTAASVFNVPLARVPPRAPAPAQQSR